MTISSSLATPARALPRSIGEITPVHAALVILFVSIATIGGAWAYQLSGYWPCDLCLQERYAYYIGIPLTIITTLLAWRGPRSVTIVAFALLGLMFAASAVLASYHAGIEWSFWKGPSDCTGPVPNTSFADFTSSLQNIKVIRCDQAAIRIFGISLAGYNALISAAMVVVAGFGIVQTSRAR